MKFSYVKDDTANKIIYQAIIDDVDDIWWLNGNGLYDCPLQEIYNESFNEVAEDYGIKRAFKEGEQLTITF